VTPAGVRIAPAGCQGCHLRVLSNGKRVDGIPTANDQGAILARLKKLDTPPLRGEAETAHLRLQYLQQFGLPWLKDDIHERFNRMSLDDFDELEGSLVGVFTRDDGSPFFLSKFPI